MIARYLRGADPIIVPAHFEADAYAGLRRMANSHEIDKGVIPYALELLGRMTGERVPLAPLLPAAYELYDQVGAHDVFYVVIARARNCPLLTVDRPLARAAQLLGVEVVYRGAH